MVNEQVKGVIHDINEEGVAIILAPLPVELALKREVKDVTIILHDGRKISPEQRRKTYALLGEIAEFVDGVRDSGTIEDTKRMMKFEYILTRMEAAERKMFSLANCDMTVAREFINFLVDFIIENDIPSSVSLKDYCEDIHRYVYACLVNKKMRRLRETDATAPC